MNFEAVNAAALAAYPAILHQWLPGGKLHGREYRCGDLRGGTGDSLSVNIQTGKWSDFANGDKGGDPVSLYAAIRKIKQSEAAKELSEVLAIRVDQPAPAKRDDAPEIIIPVPDDAPKPVLRHVKLGNPAGRWLYRNAEGRAIGYIARFNKPDGSKEILPHVYTSKGWRWLSFPKPRPLYGLDKLAARPTAPVLIVEGEKCADAAAKAIPQMVAMTWPGGSQAVKHADWSVLVGRSVTIWPDADEAGARAAEEIGNTLLGLGATVRIIDTDGQPDGWDIADAVDEGMTTQELVAWAKARVRPLERAAEPEPVQPEAPPPPAPEPDAKVVTLKPQQQAKPKREPKQRATVQDMHGRVFGQGDEWKAGLAWKDLDKWVAKSVNNAIMFLSHHPRMVGALRLNTFSQTIEVVSCPPWRPADEFEPYVLSDLDDVKAKAWLEMQEITITISETHHALVAAASHNPYNPLQEYLKGLKWDGTPRLGQWLTYYLGADATGYTAAVGKKFLIGAVARAMEPGCKMDTMLILEGPQGLKKSTAVETLFGSDWFTDEIEGIGHKDTSLQMLGRWVIEIAELDAIERAEVKAIKAWMSRKVDKFRAPYGRNVISQPRSCVFVGTENAEGGGYLKDATGARRFWPVACRAIDIDALAHDRDQLWAEAVVMYEAGEQWWLNEDEVPLAKEQQEDRYEGDPWSDDIDKFIQFRTKATTSEIMGECLAIPKERRNRSMEIRIGKHLTSLGWQRKRVRDGDRLKWVYAKPGVLDV